MGKPGAGELAAHRLIADVEALEEELEQAALGRQSRQLLIEIAGARLGAEIDLRRRGKLLAAQRGLGHQLAQQGRFAAGVAAEDGEAVAAGEMEAIDAEKATAVGRG